MEEQSQQDLETLLKTQIQIGTNLVQSLKSFEHIDGIAKLENKIKKELKFLIKMSNSHTLQANHLSCSNLNYLSAVVECLSQENNIVHIFYPITIDERKVYIDIISDKGSSWVKVIARNKKSLSEAVLGQTTTKIRNIIDHCNDYLIASKLKPNYYKEPQIKFIFANGIDDFLKLELEGKGIIVKSLDENKSLLSNESYLSSYNNIEMLNLDITAMIAYVSNLSNGHCNVELKEPLLAEQAKWERERPVNIVLNSLFEGKKLVCCKTARTAFETIIQTIGGPCEKARSLNLLDRVTTLPDDYNYDDKFSQSLKTCGKIKPRSKLIFLFGYFMRAITVTANQGFVESAKQQGFEPVVFFHEPRALTEMKENC